MGILIMSNGMGTNSVAVLCGMRERGERPDYITSADTCGEKPGTYMHRDIMQDWLKKNGFPPITMVYGSQPAQVRRGSLEAECIELGTMPSKVFGMSSCSDKWKIDPQQKFDKALCVQLGIQLSDITRIIGYDADEPERADRAILKAERNHPVNQRFPLIEWGWGRDECVEAIKRAGLPLPGKSACFFCPSSKKHEVIWLRDNHPDLYARAIEMERRALAGEGQAPAARVKGLGRHWNWKELGDATPEEAEKFCDAGTPELNCDCIG